MSYQDRHPDGRFKISRRWITFFALLTLGVVVAAIVDKTFLKAELSAFNEAVVPVALADITLEAKLELKKESILDRLAKCESGGKKEEDGITILDSNGVGSYGAFQWQKRSVQHYYEMREGKPINGRDAIILAMTPDQARDLARFVIFETANGVAKDWVNCNLRHNLQAEVDWIKSLEA